jgi:aminopeptidase N
MQQLLDLFTPTHYALDLTVDKAKLQVTGTVQITGTPRAAKIKLHADALQLHAVSIAGQPVKYTYRKHLITIPVDTKAPLTISIDFTAPVYTPDQGMFGAYLSTYQYQGREERVVATQFESHYACKLFPCVDEPAAKATFDLRVRSTDPEDTILTNLPAGETTPRMSTYLLAFAVGKLQSYRVTSRHGVVVTSYAPLHHPADLLIYPTQTAADALDYYDDVFQTPYPLPKLDQISLPDFSHGAMENWGLVTYRESMFLADERSPIDTKYQAAITITHELAHQWFGNLVTMQWWDDLWLNESFATLMSYFATDHLYPDYHIWEHFYLTEVDISLQRDALAGVQAVHQTVHDPAEIATLFDGAIVYAKGARLLLMLLRLVGQQAFFDGLKAYFEHHAYANTVGDDLWAALQPHADFDVREFMHAWIDRPGYPVVTTDGRQQRFLITAGPKSRTRWPIPHLSDDLSGHYIINLTDQELQHKLTHFDTLSLEQKLRIMLDRDLLAHTPDVSSASLIDIILALSQDTSYPVWDALAGLIGSIKAFTIDDPATEKLYKVFIAGIIPHLVDRLGITAKPGESSSDTLLRQIILCFASYSDHRQIIDQALQLYDTTPLDQLDPNTRSNILVIKVKNAETPALIDQLIAQYRASQDPDLQSDLTLALTATKRQATIHRLFELLQDTKTIRPQDTLHFYVGLLRNHHARPHALQWAYDHWDFIRQVTGPEGLDSYPRVLAGAIATPAEQQAYLKFFTPLLKDPGLARAITVALPQIEARLALLTADKPAVIARLKNLAKNP